MRSGRCGRSAAIWRVWRWMSEWSCGQNDDAAGGFGDGDVEAGGGLGHHDAAEEDAEIRDGGAAGGCDDFADGDADGDAEGDGRADGAGDGEVFVRDGLVEADVHQGFDVGDHGVDVLGQAAGRDDAAGDDVDEDELVAGRVGVGERGNADVGGGVLLERGDDVVVLFFDADDAGGRADDFHDLGHAAEEGLGEVVEKFLVLVQEGLALGGVGDDERDAGGELDRGGKAASASADDAEFGDSGGGHGRVWGLRMADF